ncbi:GldG family protein [Solimonas marina]|uniref:GldG family protein n=1 Tax=Solimonas marina TaxID=2714601 RepID=A0A970B8B6_9GAMM|nr:GldG family protein [Solimonas marina]NKF21216.1 GldG family protein [Solimonas marina]
MKDKKQVFAQQAINGLLIIAVIGLLGFLSVRFKTELDWTAGHRNTLTEASVKQLDQMKDPITFYVFAPSGAASRQTISEDLERYKRDKKNIEIKFVDPGADPQKVRDFNVQYIGQVVVEYQGRRETLNATTEPAITSALQRLSYAGDKWIVFLEGHGERTLTEGTQASFSHFAAALKDKGLKVRGLNLIQNPQIPDNTSVLVIASPTKPLLPGEEKIITDYVNHGGNLLWLADPDNPPGIEPLAKDLGVTWQNGYAIFPDYQILGTGHPGFFAAISYPPNPVTEGLDMVTLFPLVRSLTMTAVNDWYTKPLLKSEESAWLETGDINAGAVKFDGNDIKGPLMIGATLTRDFKPGPDDKTDKPHPQRIGLIGDADFLSDGYLEQLGNEQLGLNLMQWLASRDAQLNINVPKAQDTALYLPGWATMFIAGFFIALLPLGLLGFGVVRWAMRRRR